MAIRWMSVVAAAVLSGAMVSGTIAQETKRPAGGKVDQPAETHNKSASSASPKTGEKQR